jgi:S1-C subfamily serine protease
LGGTDFQVGMAEGPTVTGFEGFTQNLFRAKELALKSQKDILIVFGVSDVHPPTQELSRALQQPGMKTQITSSFIPVIVDFPQTAEGRSNIQDSAQSGPLAQEYLLDDIPTMVLLDHQAKPYYLQDVWKQGTSNLAPYLQEAAAARTERDALWKAVQGESLEPAAKFVNWLIERQIVSRFGDELTKWAPVARRLDPMNEQGHLEAFVEAQFYIDMSTVSLSDETGIERVFAPLKPFLETQRFKSEDRGARLHLEAARMLDRVRERDDARRHLARADTYKPQSAELKEALAKHKSRIERGRIVSSGTGFFISESGYILTNHHVIEGRGKVKVRLPDGKTMVDGVVIAQDDDRDMAIVKVALPEGMKVKTLPVSPKSIGRGIDVAAFGYPLASSESASLKFTKGGVSALADDSNDNMYVLDLRVNPGNSGGPLCDRKGNVVGMVTAKTRTNFFTNEDSYGMSIPSGDLVKFLDKHLPAGTPRPTPTEQGTELPWDELDALASPGVLLILKME